MTAECHGLPVPWPRLTCLPSITAELRSASVGSSAPHSVAWPWDHCIHLYSLYQWRLEEPAEVSKSGQLRILQLLWSPHLHTVHHAKLHKWLYNLQKESFKTLRVEVIIKKTLLGLGCSSEAWSLSMSWILSLTWEKGKKRCFRLDELGTWQFFSLYSREQILIDAIRTPGYALASLKLERPKTWDHLLKPQWSCWGWWLVR